MEDIKKKEAAKGAPQLFAKFLARVKTDKKFEYAVYGALGILAVLLMVWPTADKKGGQSNKLAEDTSAGSMILTQSGGEGETEARLKQILSHIRGAGVVEVMITYETGKQIVPAMSTDVQSSTTQSQGDVSSVSESVNESSQPATVSRNGGNEAIVLTEVQPKVRGVIVIAEGAADVRVRVNLQNAVMTVLGIDADCIDVFEMKQQNNGGET